MMDKNSSACNAWAKNEMASLKEITKKVLAKAKELGASDAEVAASVDKGLSVTTRLKEVETLEYNQDKGLGITVYVGQRRGSVSSSDTSDTSIDALVQRAVELAKVSDEDNCFGLAEKALLTQEYPELDLYHPVMMDGAEAIAIAKDLETKALDKDKRIVNSEGASFGTYQFLRVYAHTHDFLGGYQATRHTKSCVLLAQCEDGGLERDYDYSTARDFDQLTSNQDLADSAVANTLKRVNAKKINTGEYPVIFTSDVSSSLLGTLVSAISGGAIYRRSSFLLDHIGQAVLPERYEVFEKPHVKGALGSAPYDGEGVLTRNNTFVHQGVLQSYVLGSYSARRLGLETTANAGGVHNLTISNDGLSFAELVKDMNEGLIVTELMGQGVNVVTGNYSRGASGFWVENGEIQFPVHEITVASNLKDMLLGIRSIADDEDTRKATNCGSMLIDKMTVAGA